MEAAAASVSSEDLTIIKDGNIKDQNSADCNTCEKPNDINKVTENNKDETASDCSSEIIFVTTVRNPSPPPGMSDALFPDKIEDTVYSKKWVLATVIEVVKFLNPDIETVCLDDSDVKEDVDIQCDKNNEGVSKETSNEEIDKNTSELDGDTKTDNDDDVKFVSEKVNTRLFLPNDLEEKLSDFWDATRDFGVSKFIVENHILETLYDVLVKTKITRLQEIAIGIISNVLCFPRLSPIILSFKPLQLAVLGLICTSRDSGVIASAFRFYNVFCSYENALLQLVSTLNDIHIIDKIVFILNNSINDEVLSAVFQFVHTGLDKSEALFKSWATEDLLLALCVAVGEFGVSDSEPQTASAVGYGVNSIQMFTTNNETLVLVNKNCNVLLETFETILSIIDEYQFIDEYSYVMASVFSSCLPIIFSKPIEDQISIFSKHHIFIVLLVDSLCAFSKEKSPNPSHKAFYYAKMFLSELSMLNETTNQGLLKVLDEENSALLQEVFLKYLADTNLSSNEDDDDIIAIDGDNDEKDSTVDVVNINSTVEKKNGNNSDECNASPSKSEDNCKLEMLSNSDKCSSVETTDKQLNHSLCTSEETSVSVT